MILDGYGKRDGLTVNTIYNDIHGEGDEYLGAGEIMAFLLQYGVACHWRVNLTTPILFECLMHRKPAVCLIWYKPLVDCGLTEKLTFTGRHFVVAVGMDIEAVSILDPYRSAEAEPVRVPHATWMTAWTGNEPEVMPIRGALVMEYPLSKVPPEPGVPATGWDGVTTGSLYIRAEPNANAKILGGLTPGAKVHIEDEMNGWGRMARGWVRLTYVKKV